uniref:Uncharacterized protein n=1 Tax=Anguilla anguilla TaxID=7936 RepID=A0A0E9W518_ANGAN
MSPLESMQQLLFSTCVDMWIDRLEPVNNVQAELIKKRPWEM